MSTPKRTKKSSAAKTGPVDAQGACVQTASGDSRPGGFGAPGELHQWDNESNDAACMRPDIDATECYDAAMLKLEQAELLLESERLFIERSDTESGTIDPVMEAALALVILARTGFRAAFCRAMDAKAGTP